MIDGTPTDTAVTLEDLQTQLATLQTALKEKDEKIVELNTAINDDQKKAFEKRDAAKKAEKLALEQQQKFEELYKTIQTEFEEYKTNYKSDEFEAYKNKSIQFDNYITEQKAKLLEKLDESDRETFKDLDLSKLQVIVDKLTGDKVVNVDTSTIHTTKNITGKKWSDMTEKERLDLSTSDPKRTQTLLAEYLKEKKK